MLISLIISFIFADAVDHIEAGKITSPANCILCGGRFLCGATNETLAINIFNNNQIATVKSFCHKKTLSYKKQKIDRMPWISDEMQNHLVLAKAIDSISLTKSKSKYTDNRIADINDKKLQTRINYRLKNGVTYSELKSTWGKEKLKNNEQSKLLLPALSYEQFTAKKYGNKNKYHEYLVGLISAPIKLLVSTNGEYYQKAKLIAQDKNDIPALSSDKKGKKPIDFYYMSEIKDFFKKAQSYPHEFCEKLNYRKVIDANARSLRKIAKAYGGHSLIEQNYYYQILSDEFQLMQKQEVKKCNKNMAKFVHIALANMPNPAILKLIQENKPAASSRMPSSVTKPKGSLRCRFNIDNYQEECD